MKWPRYAAYKQVDVEWIDTVPVSWRVLAAKRVIARIESGTSVNAADIPASPGDLAVLKTSCVYSGEFSPTENKTVYDPDEMARVTCPLRADTLIVSRMNTPDLVGAAGYVDAAVDGLFLPDRLWQITFNQDVVPRWMHYWTKTPSYRDQLRAICVGTSSSMQNISQADFGSLVLALPRREEQHAIAQFLDQEVEKIDALIAKQQQLIAILREDRTATIFRAVTKGIDPKVEMKDSGVAWLGDVPIHWSKRRLATTYKELDQRLGNRDAPELLSVSIHVGVRPRKELITDKEARADDFTRYKLCRAGDIILNRMRAFQGGLGVAYEDGIVSPDYMVMRVNPSESAEFLGYLMKTPWFVEQMTSRLRGIGGVDQGNARTPRINPRDLGSIEVALPHMAEQLRIVEDLSFRLLKVDALIAKAHEVVSVLHEYRSALIADVVTGKIDVRGAVA